MLWERCVDMLHCEFPPRYLSSEPVRVDKNPSLTTLHNFYYIANKVLGILRETLRLIARKSHKCCISCIDHKRIKSEFALVNWNSLLNESRPTNIPQHHAVIDSTLTVIAMSPNVIIEISLSRHWRLTYGIKS